jgi:EamA-like transporter family
VAASDGERVALTAFVIYTVLAGGNAVCIRFSNRELAPLWGASLRFALAGALLLAVMVVLRLAFPCGRASSDRCSTACSTSAPGLGWSITGSSGSMPDSARYCWHWCHWPRSCSRCFGGRSTSVPRRVMGTLLAFAGIAVVSRTPLQEDVPVLSVLAVVGGAICFAQALVLVRRFPRVHPVTMNAVGMTGGAAVLLIASLLADEPIVLPQRPETWAAMAYLVVVGSVVVFLLYLVVLRYWGGFTGVLWVRDHPVRHRRALSLARQ